MSSPESLFCSNGHNYFGFDESDCTICIAERDGECGCDENSIMGCEVCNPYEDDCYEPTAEDLEYFSDYQVDYYDGYEIAEFDG